MDGNDTEQDSLMPKKIKLQLFVEEAGTVVMRHILIFKSYKAT